MWDLVWKWLSDNNGALGFALALITAASALYHYLTIKKSEDAARRFTSYHNMIRDLNVGEDGGAPYLDKQVAIVFEMRNFPEYYPATLRILKRSIKRWRLSASLNTNPFSPNILADEAELTIKFINRKMDEQSYLCIPEEDRL